MTDISVDSNQRISRSHTNWLIRVPCPGGSGARTTGWGALASLLSDPVFTSGILASAASGAFTGAAAGALETLGMLMNKILAS